MPGIEAELGALAEREEPAWQRALAIDADESFGADQVAGRAEQGMAALDGAHLDPVDLVDRPAKDLRLDRLHPAAIGAEALVPDDQRQCHGIDAEYQRPFLGDDMKKAIDRARLDGREHGLMNRSDGARMATGECDQVLVRLLGGSKPLPQVRDSPLFEGDHRSHCGEEYPGSG
jgi:hypothetical protein